MRLLILNFKINFCAIKVQGFGEFLVYDDDPWLDMSQ